VLALILLTVSVGLADSVNPSTIGPALYLATGPAATRRLVLFTLGVFAVYCTGGLVLAAGPGRAILAAVPHPDREDTHLLELALGGLALAVAAVLWLQRDAVARRVGIEERRAARSTFVLGAAIMAVELPTAFPYFAVVAAVIGSGEGMIRQLVLVVLFNLAFVTPLVAIAALRAVAGPRADRPLTRIRGILDRHAPALVVAVMTILAAALFVVGAVGLVSLR
jgi:cytochrome c biogenesis protein CcdA